MAAKKKNTLFGSLVTVVIIAAVLWMKYNEVREGQTRDGELRDKNVTITGPTESTGHAENGKRDQSRATSVHAPVGKSSAAPAPGQGKGQPGFRAVSLSSSRFQIWKNCTLLDRRGNDGDSFHIEASHGNEEVRLYFVDAPESAARTYGNGDTNHKRIAQQGAAMGGLNQHETTQVGVAAKAFTKKLLKGKKFTVATTGERVYGSHRKYAFVIVDWQGQPRYLHELLVAYGLGRIHTKPMILPDNTASSRQKKQLYNLEEFAKENRYGAWGVK